MPPAEALQSREKPGVATGSNGQREDKSREESLEAPSVPPADGIHVCMREGHLRSDPPHLTCSPPLPQAGKALPLLDVLKTLKCVYVCVHHRSERRKRRQCAGPAAAPERNNPLFLSSNSSSTMRSPLMRSPLTSPTSSQSAEMSNLFSRNSMARSPPS